MYKKLSLFEFFTVRFEGCTKSDIYINKVYMMNGTCIRRQKSSKKQSTFLYSVSGKNHTFPGFFCTNPATVESNFSVVSGFGRWSFMPTERLF